MSATRKRAETWRVRRSGAYSIEPSRGDDGRPALSVAFEAPGFPGVDAVGVLMSRREAVNLMGRLGRLIEETWPDEGGED